MQQDIVDKVDYNDFSVKFFSSKLQWEKLCPGFYESFAMHCKKSLLKARFSQQRVRTNVEGFYYQDNVDSLHAFEK